MTKIVATLGPSSNSKEVIRGMIRAGMNIARINFSHGDQETQGKTIDLVREVAAEEGTVIGILADIQGPKIRLGKVAQPIPVKAGDHFEFTLDEADGSNGIIQLPHPEFVVDIQPGMPLLYGDGEMQFEVVEKRARSLIVEAAVDGLIESRKGIMAPTARLSLSAITEKDRRDIEFVLKKNPEYMALSFVRSADDIRQLRWLIDLLTGEQRVGIIAKIEKFDALDVLEEIIDVCDGIMVARGDLGLEIPPQHVPREQKRMIRLCNERAKPVITATQMLSSMESSPRPTRAEVSDVYNAIVDGTDAVMLSNETANGTYPIESVQMMSDIALTAEARISPERPEVNRVRREKEAITDAIAASVYEIAKQLKPRAIVTSTISGYTARNVSAERARVPIICVTPNENTYRRMSLVWGVTPIMIPQFNTIDEMLDLVVKACKKAGYVKPEDVLVVIAGIPFGIGGQTNFLKVHVVPMDV
ncbi:MAG: pyruvate kinase [Phototrophicaceae bacterium]|jgi:pyruvate kinase